MLNTSILMCVLSCGFVLWFTVKKFEKHVVLGTYLTFMISNVQKFRIFFSLGLNPVVFFLLHFLLLLSSTYFSFQLLNSCKSIRFFFLGLFFIFFHLCQYCLLHTALLECCHPIWGGQTGEMLCLFALRETEAETDEDLCCTCFSIAPPDPGHLLVVVEAFS